jgi:hypothetical protein
MSTEHRSYGINTIKEWILNLYPGRRRDVGRQRTMPSSESEQANGLSEKTMMQKYVTNTILDITHVLKLRFGDSLEPQRKGNVCRCKPLPED